MDNETLQRLKKEIRFRGRRGMKELDIWIGDFIARFVDTLNEAELIQLRDLLLQPEQDLWQWLCDEKPAPAFDTPIFTQLLRSRRTVQV